MEHSEDEAILKDLASITAEIKRIETITSELTEFSAKGDVQLESANINKVIEQVLENLKNQEQFENIEVQQKLTPRPAQLFTGHPFDATGVRQPCRQRQTRNGRERNTDRFHGVPRHE